MAPRVERVVITPRRMMAATIPTTMPTMPPMPMPLEPPPPGDGAELPDAEAPVVTGEEGGGEAAGGDAGAAGGDAEGPCTR